MHRAKIDIYGWLILIFTILAALFLTIFTANAQWEEVPNTGTTLDFGGLFTDDASSYTAQAIHAGTSYWIGAQASQITADGETKAQDIAARAQKGFGFLGISAEFYVEANRNLDTALATSTGGYLRKVFVYDKLKFIFGAGSLLEREEVRADYGLEATDPTTLPYWIGIAAAQYQFTDKIGISTRFIGNPKLDFDKWKGNAEFALEVRVADNAILKFQSSNAFQQNPDGTEIDTENSVILSLNY